MKIIITTTATFIKAIEESDLYNELAKHGINVILCPDFDPPFTFDTQKVIGIVAGHNLKGLMPRVGPGILKQFPNLKVVSPFGIGTNHLDIAGLEEAGITVKKLPHLSKRTVAELAITFLFVLARRIVPMAMDMKNELWQRLDAVQLSGKYLGIIGLGNIGKEVAKMARGLDMRVLAYDNSYDESFLSKYGIEKSSLKDIFLNSDAITVHTPLTDETKNLIDNQAFSLMKKGVLIINTSRGSVVNEEALLGALESGRVGGAALDVFSVEPPFNNEVLKKLIGYPNVITTPHVGAFTKEARYAIAKEIYEGVARLLN